MSNNYSPEEIAAIEQDCRRGMQQIVAFLGGCTAAFPTAVGVLNPHATSSRKLRAAYSDLLSAKQNIQAALDFGLKVHTSNTKRNTPDA